MEGSLRGCVANINTLEGVEWTFMHLDGSNAQLFDVHCHADTHVALCSKLTRTGMGVENTLRLGYRMSL